MRQIIERLRGSGFRVEFENPRALFRLLQSNAPSVLQAAQRRPEEWIDEDIPDEQLSGDLNDVRFNDDMFKGGISTIILGSSLQPPYTPEYNISTLLLLSERQRRNKPYGFYTDDRVATLVDDLQSQKLPASVFEHDLLRLRIQRKQIHIPGKNVDIEVKFGPDEKWFNKRVSIDLVGHHELDVPLTEESTFLEQTKFYADVYSKVIRTLYRESGFSVPSITVLLQTPQQLRDMNEITKDVL